MNEECLICKAPLEYLDTDERMECMLCHKKMKTDPILCTRSHLNNQCLSAECPFHRETVPSESF